MNQFFGAKSRDMPVFRRVATQLIAPLLLLLSSSLSAQSTSELFRGTWELQTPDEGSLIVILKNQGIASCFWGDNTDRTVYPGEWASTNSAATISWEQGSSHVIQRTDTGFVATFTDSAGTEVYSSAASQLPREILGQWAKPPTREDELRSDRDRAKGFFGIWRIGDSGKYVFVEADRSAASTDGPQDSGQRGEWAKQGSELHIIWDSGEYGILSQTERGYTYRLVGPGDLIEDAQGDSQTAIRTVESKAPGAWYAAYQNERETDTGGLAFASRKEARSFYRGNWVVRRGSNSFEQIELARFGGLKTSADRSLDGEWALSGQDVFMQWDDGIRKILSPVGRGFVLYEYMPGRPLDGVPNRVLAAAPTETSKLEEHLKGREAVALQLQQMAEAAGISPESAKEEAGWGRTFARWAWPFGGDDEAATSEELLVEEFEPEDSDSPWWWPFWSEKSDKETVPVEMVEVAAPEGDQASAEGTETEYSPAPKAKRTVRDWIWPF